MVLGRSNVVAVNCKRTCRFLCRPPAVGPGCKGQSATRGTATHRGGRPGGRHSAGTGPRSESRLRDERRVLINTSSSSGFSQKILRMRLIPPLTHVGVSAGVRAVGGAVRGRGVGRHGVHEFRALARLAASETPGVRVIARPE